MSLRPDIPDSGLQNAWTEAVRDEFDVGVTLHYELRRQRGLASNVAAGRPRKVARTGSTTIELNKAVDSGTIAPRTAYEYKQLKRARPVQSSTRTQTEHDRARLCILFRCVKDSFDEFLAHFMLTLAFARELLRVGVDPLVSTLNWSSMVFPVRLFLRILTTKNVMVRGEPSMHQALFGKPGQEEQTTMHMHNWWLQDDAAHKELENMLSNGSNGIWMWACRSSWCPSLVSTTGKRSRRGWEHAKA